VYIHLLLTIDKSQNGSVSKKATSISTGGSVDFSSPGKLEFIFRRRCLGGGKGVRI
jgi:hypothetical protein